MSFNNDARKRISRATKIVEQSQVLASRPKKRHPAPMSGGGSTTRIVWAKHDEDIKKAKYDKDPTKVIFNAVEVEIYKLVRKDDDTNKEGEVGEYKLEPIMDGDEPKKMIVINPSFSDDIAKDEWFGFVPTSAKLQVATILSC